MPISTIEVKPTNEIIKSECQERRYNEININMFNDGIAYMANKILMYSRLTKEEYYIILNTNKGYLVSTNMDIIRAENEFSFLCSENESAKGGLPLTTNLFGYKLYNKNMEEFVDTKGSPPGPDGDIAA